MMRKQVEGMVSRAFSKNNKDAIQENKITTKGRKRKKEKEKQSATPMKSDANVGVGSPLKGSPAEIFGLPLKSWACSFRLLSLLLAPFCPKPRSNLFYIKKVYTHLKIYL